MILKKYSIYETIQILIVILFLYFLFFFNDIYYLPITDYLDQFYAQKQVKLRHFNFFNVEELIPSLLNGLNYNYLPPSEFHFETVLEYVFGMETSHLIIQLLGKLSIFLLSIKLLSFFVENLQINIVSASFIAFSDFWPFMTLTIFCVLILLNIVINNSKLSNQNLLILSATPLLYEIYLGGIWISVFLFIYLFKLFLRLKENKYIYASILHLTFIVLSSYRLFFEIIFGEEYNLALGKTHNWSGYGMPDGFKAGWGSNMHMYLASDARFEHQDGSPGNKHHNKFNNKTWFDIEEVIYTKDPRYLATLFTPEEIFQGREVWFHNLSVGNAAAGVKGRAGNVAPQRAPVRNRNRGGRLVQKRIDPRIEFPPFGTDETPYIVLRTGEMYLNAAEAAFEIGKTDRATNLINTLRGRVGMPAKTNLTLDLIKNERFVELYAENHRYWDLRTWRDAEKELHFKLKQGSKWTRRASDGMYKANKWRWNFGQNTPFLEKMYWLPYGTNRISDNPNLIENPGY